jgi:hypothetical protein
MKRKKGCPSLYPVDMSGGSIEFPPKTVHPLLFLILNRILLRMHITQMNYCPRPQNNPQPLLHTPKKHNITTNQPTRMMKITVIRRMMKGGNGQEVRRKKLILWMRRRWRRRERKIAQFGSSGTH